MRLYVAAIVVLVPLCKFSQTFSQSDFGREAKISFECRTVCVSNWHISRLHGDQLLVGFEVVVFGQDADTHQLLLQDVHEVQQVLRLAAADVIHLVRCQREAVFAGLLLGGFLHHSHDAFHNVVYICEVASAVAVVVYLDSFAFQQFIGEAKVGHVGTARRTVDGEEPQASAGDVVELAVAVGEELVALLGGGIEADGVIHIIVGGEGDFLVAAIDAGAGCVHKMLNTRIVDS